MKSKIVKCKEILVQIDEDVFQEVQEDIQAKYFSGSLVGTSSERFVIHIIEAIRNDLKSVHISFKKKRKTNKKEKTKCSKTKNLV